MMTWRMSNTRSGPEWSGHDTLYNPRHAQRWPFLIVGVTLIVAHYVLMSIVSSLMYSYLNAEDADSIAWWGLKFLVLPGAAMLVYGGWFCRKYLKRSWRLNASETDLIYSRPVGSVLGWTPAPQNDSLALREEWHARLADVARVETSTTAEWEPARSGGFGDTAVSRDEVQAFLFMNDGSRRVIASVHAGREDMAKLTHSIRCWLDGQRQEKRLAVTPRSVIATAGPAEGFDI